MAYFRRILGKDCWVAFGDLRGRRCKNSNKDGDCDALPLEVTGRCSSVVLRTMRGWIIYHDLTILNTQRCDAPTPRPLAESVATTSACTALTLLLLFNQRNQIRAKNQCKPPGFDVYSQWKLSNHYFTLLQ